MAIERPKAIDDAPACGPQQREGRQPGEFLASRGMGAAQGKKLARRRCGIGDRGAAGLRADQAIEEAVWERCHQTATKQENWRPSFTGRNSAAPGETAPSSQPFRRISQTNVADGERPHSRPRQSIGLAPRAPPVPARASTAPQSRRCPDDPSTPDCGPSSEPRNGLHDARSWLMDVVAANGSCLVRCPHRLAGGLPDASRDGDVEDDRRDVREGAVCR